MEQEPAPKPRANDRKRWRNAAGRKLHIDNTAISWEDASTMQQQPLCIALFCTIRRQHAQRPTFASTICTSFLVEPLVQSSVIQASPFLRFFFNVVGDELR